MEQCRSGSCNLFSNCTAALCESDGNCGDRKVVWKRCSDEAITCKRGSGLKAQCVSDRKGELTGHYPSMFLLKTGEKKEAGNERNALRRGTPPPRR